VTFPSARTHIPCLVWLAATTTYNAIERTVRYISDLPPHPSVSVFELNFPTTRVSILQAFRAHLDALKTKLQKAQPKIGDGTKLKIVAVIDSIASNPGVYLPWKEMVTLCRERGILTIIDAAHSLGQEPDLNLSEAGPDFWVSVRLTL
jgi:hercynylcysteine S-oxide lyase